MFLDAGEPGVGDEHASIPVEFLVVGTGNDLLRHLCPPDEDGLLEQSGLLPLF